MKRSTSSPGMSIRLNLSATRWHRLKSPGLSSMKKIVRWKSSSPMSFSPSPSGNGGRTSAWHPNSPSGTWMSSVKKNTTRPCRTGTNPWKHCLTWIRAWPGFFSKKAYTRPRSCLGHLLKNFCKLTELKMKSRPPPWWRPQNNG